MRRVLTMRRVLNKDEVIVYEFLVKLWYPADFLSGCCGFSWFPLAGLPLLASCFFVVVAPNPRIL